MGGGVPPRKTFWLSYLCVCAALTKGHQWCVQNKTFTSQSLPRSTREGGGERERERASEPWSPPPCKDVNSIMSGSTLMTSSQPNYLPKAPSPNTIMLEVRTSPYKLGVGTQFSPQISAPASPDHVLLAGKIQIFHSNSPRILS